MKIWRTIESVEFHDIFRAHYVERAELFGSAVTDAFTNESDVDILVTFSDELPILDYAENSFDLKDQLELKVGRSVDLVSINSLSFRISRSMLSSCFLSLLKASLSMWTNSMAVLF